MQNSQLNRVIKLIKRTGEKTIIMDNESDAVMMLMDLSVYEKMLERSQGIEKLTEEEMLEKINRDVAIWRASNDSREQEMDAYEDVLEKPQSARTTMPAQVSVQEKPVVMEKAKEASLPPAAEIPVIVSQIPTAQSEQEEHSASDIVSEEDEEKFYLEPVE